MREREQAPENAPQASSPEPGRSEDQASLLRLQQSAGNAAVARLVAGRSLQRQPLGPDADPRVGAIWHHIYSPGSTLEGTLTTTQGSSHASFTLDAGSELLAKHGRTIT